MRRRFFNTTKGVDINNYLTIEALEDGLTASLSIKACEYCVDGDGNWKTLDANTVTESINTGHTLSFRNKVSSGVATSIGTFTVNKNFNLKGNCMSMLFGDAGKDRYTLAGYPGAFNELFYNCTTLISVSANFLPATTLSEGCYYSMFKNCTSLTTAPVLPATTLAGSCYRSMFELCSNLISAPELPATTLTNFCYIYIFYGCRKLNYIKMLATNISAYQCLNRWVVGVASAGTFVKNPEATWEVYGSDGIPNGWRVKFDGEERVEITFYIDGVEYKAEEGMTWFDWCNDTYYSKGKWVVEGNAIHSKDQTASICAYACDTIVSGQNYRLLALGGGGGGN